MKTPHERFLARKKQQAQPSRKVLELAKLERQRAEQMVAEAQEILTQAQAKLDAALLHGHGWTFSYSRWTHPSGFRLLIEPRHYWIWTPPGIEALKSVILCYSIEEALERWILLTTHLGRYPEPPLPSLYTRLRLGIVQKVMDE